MFEHPQIVHFPIALLLCAMLSELISYKMQREFWEKVTLFLMGLGVVSALAAVLSGDAAADKVEKAAGIAALISQHRQAALWVLGLFSIIWIIKVVLYHFRIDRLQYRLILTLLMVLGAFQIYQAGHFGGNLVYRHGIGVQKTK